MTSMDGLDLVLFVASGWVAVVALARLMRRYRESQAAQMRAELKAEQQRLQTLQQPPQPQYRRAA